MILNRWSDEIDSPENYPIFVYEGNPSEEVWTMRDGTQIRVGDMTSSHLQNCYKMALNSRNLFWIRVFKAETEKRIDRATEEAPTLKYADYGDISDRPELTKIADEMQKAITDAYTEHLRANERKLEEVLKNNGWCKAVDFLDEIELATRQLKMPTLVRWNLEDLFIKLREKYSGGKK